MPAARAAGGGAMRAGTNLATSGSRSFAPVHRPKPFWHSCKSVSTPITPWWPTSQKSRCCDLRSSEGRSGCVQLRSAWSQADRTIQADHFAIEHVVFKDVFGQFGVVLRRAQAAREGHTGGQRV